MHLVLTLAAFLLLTAAIVVLRLSWQRISPAAQRASIACACISLLLSAFSFVTHWSFTSPRANAALYWTAVASYELFLVLFTLLRPRLLTSLLALLLLLPILSTSIFVPLSEIFDHISSSMVPMRGDLFSERRPFASNSSAYTGVDLTVYFRPRWAPFLRHRRRGARYLNSQCNTAQSSAVLEPGATSVHMVCPAWPWEKGKGATDLVVPLE